MENYLLKVVEQYLVVIANPLEAPSSFETGGKRRNLCQCATPQVARLKRLSATFEARFRTNMLMNHQRAVEL